MSLFAALERLLSGSERAADPSHPMARLVRAQMPDASEDTRRLVTAVAGLLACVAYADREFSEPEREAMRNELARLPGMKPGRAARVVDERGHDIRVWLPRSVERRRSLSSRGRCYSQRG